MPSLALQGSIAERKVDGKHWRSEEAVMGNAVWTVSLIHIGLALLSFCSTDSESICMG